MPAQTAKPTDDLNVISYHFNLNRLGHVLGGKRIRKKRGTENLYLGLKIKLTEMNGYLVSSIWEQKLYMIALYQNIATSLFQWEDSQKKLLEIRNKTLWSNLMISPPNLEAKPFWISHQVARTINRECINMQQAKFKEIARWKNKRDIYQVSWATII